MGKMNTYLMSSSSLKYSFNMGVALKNKGKLDEAIDAYKKAISLNPMHFKAYYNMGNALKDQGELEEAIKFFNKAFISWSLKLR